MWPIKKKKGEEKFVESDVAKKITNVISGIPMPSSNETKRQNNSSYDYTCYICDQKQSGFGPYEVILISHAYKPPLQTRRNICSQCYGDILFMKIKRERIVRDLKEDSD